MHGRKRIVPCDVDNKALREQFLGEMQRPGFLLKTMIDDPATCHRPMS